MSKFKIECVNIFERALKLIKEETVLATAEVVSNDYVEDRYKSIEQQLRHIVKFYEAADGLISIEDEEDIYNIKSVCRRLKRVKTKNDKYRVIEKALDLCESVDLDTFSEIESAIVDLEVPLEDELIFTVYKRITKKCDMLGVRSGNHTILWEDSIDDVVKYFKEVGINKELLENMIDYCLDSDFINNKEVAKLQALVTM